MTSACSHFSNAVSKIGCFRDDTNIRSNHTFYGNYVILNNISCNEHLIQLKQLFLTFKFIRFFMKSNTFSEILLLKINEAVANTY